MADDNLPVGAVYPTPKQALATLLSSLRYTSGRRGVAANVKEGSELYERYWAIAQRISQAIANGKVGLRNTNPVDAQGDALLEWASVFGVEGRPATSSLGFVIATVNSPALSVPIPQGFIATAPNGVRYEVTKDNSAVEDGDLVEVRAKDTGPNGDQDAGVVLTWDDASIGFLGQKCTVSSGGLDGGRDADNVETVRSRLLRKLSFPAVGGNWSHVVTLAEDSSTAVEFVAVYETARGPSTTDIAIVGSPDEPVLNTAVQTQVVSAVIAEMPGNVNYNLTSVFIELLDVVVNLGLPLPKNAGGEGGGWFDAEPYPSTNEAPGVFARVTAIPSSYVLTVDSTSADPPVAGKRFAIWDPVAKKINQHAIIGVSGISGSYNIIIDSGFTPDLSYVQVGMYLSAGAELLESYAQTVLSFMQLLGPGEKTDNPDILQYARRKPKQSVNRQSALTSLALTELQHAHSEISDVSYGARYETGTVVTRTKPSVPSVVATSPRQLGLKHLSFRAVV